MFLNITSFAPISHSSALTVILSAAAAEPAFSSLMPLELPVENTILDSSALPLAIWSSLSAGALLLCRWQLAVSLCYPSRIFKRITGIPFTDYMNGVRIKESERLIRLGGLPMSEIALAAGFRSATQFGRVFKKTVGVSPSEYKRQHKLRASDK